MDELTRALMDMPPPTKKIHTVSIQGQEIETTLTDVNDKAIRLERIIAPNNQEEL